MSDLKTVTFDATLLPCPFCGGPVELERTIEGRSWWGVVCRNTKNRGGTCAVQIRPSASKEAAVERWNMRAPTPAAQSAGQEADAYLVTNANGAVGAWIREENARISAAQYDGAVEPLFRHAAPVNGGERFEDKFVATYGHRLALLLGIDAYDIADRDAKILTTLRAADAQQVGVTLAGEQVEWIVNDNAELGVKLGQQFFFLYKGESLVYGEAVHDDGSPMHWRRVFKREFGECAHPLNYEDPKLIGAVSLDDSEDWQRLPAAITSPAKVGDSTCQRCGGSRVVDNGEITGCGGVEFENGPIKCVKDCPDCAVPAKVGGDERLSGWRFEDREGGDVVVTPPDGSPWVSHPGNPSYAVVKIARAALSAGGREDVRSFPALTELLAAHAGELERNAYAYFELAYTRHTEWMAWICSNSRESDPGRKVIARGQGATPEEACRAAIAANQAKGDVL